MFKMCLLFIQAATLFLPFAIASVLSTSSATASSSPQDITTVAGTTGPDHISILFNAPCPGCFENPDDGLDLVLDIDSAEEECSAIAPRLNGLPLVSSTHGNGAASGQVFLQTKPASDSSVRNVHASWESTCLNGEASIISVRVEGIVGQGPLNESSGFTTSFKQKGQPKVLRLQNKPVNQLSQDLCDEWLASIDQEISITPTLSDPESPVDLMLQAEYAKLAQLQADMEVIHERLHSTLGKIMSLLKQKFTSCSSMQCVWKTAVNEVSPIANILVSHFKYHKNLINKELFSGCREGDAQSPCSAAIQDEIQEDEISIDTENGDLQGHVSHDATSSPTPAAPTTQPTSDSQPTTRAEATSSATEYVQVASSTAINHAQVASPSPPANHYGLLQVQPHDEQVALQRKLGLAIILLVLLVILSGVVIRAIIKYRHPRRRAERAALWEERQTRRLYRKAACKHKWRTFWKNLCSRKQATDEYEEKAQTILAEEGLIDDDGSGLHKEIRTMRNASEFVRDIVVEAEEGRARNVRSGNRYPDGFEPAELNGGVGSSRSSDIAPSYKSDVTPPPGYEEELEGEIVIIDGFRYTYTSSTTDLSSESSIVDCSPRLSLETGRSTILTKDTQD